ncbi:hypothetical protein VTI28DRAFT_3537 [Corynascus sepedonium]
MTDPASRHSEEHSPIQVDTVRAESGRQVAVVRDSQGNIVYPSYVPPATQFPTRSGVPIGEQHRKTSHQQELEPEEAADGVSLDINGPSRRPPPPAAKRWATEQPQSSGTRGGVAAVMRRAGTDVDQAAAVEAPAGDETSSSDSSSSSSDSDSSDEEDNERARSRTEKQARTWNKNGDDHFRRFRITNEYYRTKGKVSKRDGRLKISLHDTSNTGYLAKALGTAARKMVPLATTNEEEDKEEREKRPPSRASDHPKAKSTVLARTSPPPPRLNIVIMVIGSRGDAQPFLKIARILHDQYGHRVRIATHPAFRDFVQKDCPGVEFFSVGGDPSELMAFMTKNPGMIPTLESVKAGDVGRRRQAMASMFRGFWRACINATDDEADAANVRLMGERDPFVADAIIANPPCFAHLHCAEALGIPLHLMFTFPYTPTQAFPHPLASVKKSNVDPGYTNWISYPLVEMMVWQGLGDLVNEFRVDTLGLDPVSTLWAPGSTYRLHVPFTYLWSPGLVPKPADWGDEVDIAGFVFLDLASSFDPPKELVRFLEADEEPPIYIGFGSIVVDDADQFTKMIFEAVKMAGVRALVSKGWGGLGGDSLDVPDNVYLLDNTPHDWLFPRVRACVIHGGAGTTAIALKCGKPTMIVPFFGDQHFWGSMVGNAGAGPQPLPYKHLTAEGLAEGIKYCITDEARKAAGKIAKQIEEEGDGAENACRAFHRGLVLHGKGSMRCSLLPDQVAVWQVKKTGLRLSAAAAEMLVERRMLSWKQLHLLRHNEWNDFEGPGEPLTGAAGSLMTSVGNIFRGVGGVPYRAGKKAKRRRERKKQKQEKKRREGEGSNREEGEQSSENSKPDSNKSPPAVETTTTHAINRHNTASTIATNPVEDVAREVGRGAAKSASALARTPVDLSLALAQGFHNAPRLYGDDTVRRPTRVTGIKSGLRAARHEFAYGIYDGWAGVVRLPARGARDDGVRGFVSGVGMGVTGFALKNVAAIIGPVGYTLQGVAKQAERRGKPIKYIRRARIVQGRRDSASLSSGEKKNKAEEAVAGWKLMRQLWAEMKRAEREDEKGLRGRFSGNAKRLRRRSEWNAVFEDVNVARRALDSLRSNGLDSALAVARLEHETSPGEADNDDASSTLVGHHGGASSAHEFVHDNPRSNEVQKSRLSGDALEDGNPFSAPSPEATEGKDESRHLVPVAAGQVAG